MNCIEMPIPESHPDAPVRELVRERPGRRLRAQWSRHGGTTRVSLEVNVLGGFEMYGYLAVECTRSPAGREGVEIGVAPGVAEGGFAPTLAPAGDTVQPGLPAEYADSVMDGLRRGTELYGLSGRHALQVVSAAHAFAGSNPFIFSKIAFFAAIILATPPDELTDAFFDRMLDELSKPLPERG